MKDNEANSMDGPPPAKLRKASGLPEQEDADETLSGMAKNPMTSFLMGMQMAEQGIQLMMGSSPELAPALSYGLSELKKLAAQGAAGLSGGPSGPMPMPGMPGPGMGGPMGPMAQGVMPPGPAGPMAPGAGGVPPGVAGMPIPPGV